MGPDLHDDPLPDPAEPDDSLLAVIVDGSQDAIIASDLGGLITSWNPAASRMFGVDASDVVGRPIDDFIVSESAVGGDPHQRVTATPLHDQLGMTTGACTVIRESFTAASMWHQAIVHDLRGPVAMAGSLVRQAMDLPDDASPGRRQVLELAARCVDQTGRLLEDVGMLFRACDDFDLQPMDLGEVIDQVADGIPGLVVDHEGLPHDVFGCRTTMARMVQNILQNARRYGVDATASAHVQVSAVAMPSRWSIHFDDDGPGIAADDIDRVFEPYYRASSPTTLEGTGLGLAIVRAGAIAHGGSAHVENRPAGGLRVAVRIAR